MEKHKEMNLAGKKVLMIGMGLSGNASLRLLKAKGAVCDVYDSKKDPEIDQDLKAEIRAFYLGGASVDFLNSDYDLAVCSPGVPTQVGIVKEAKDAGLLVLGELELAYRFAVGKFIGITGTNGKTTTTTWVHDVFVRAGLKAHLAGNVGIPLSEVVLEHAEPDDIYICELSSYQLESIIEFKPAIAAILNITPDHLARHGSMEAYAEAKYGIAGNMDANGVLVLNWDDERLRERYHQEQGKPYQVIAFSKYDPAAEISTAKEDVQIGLRGEHNLENALAVHAIARAYGIDEKFIQESLREFKGVAHRNEFVTAIDGVSYYNDSKATNPEASIPALKSIDEPVLLIAGGMDKKNDYSEWIDYFGKVRFVCLFGETKYDIAEAMMQKGFRKFRIFDCLDEAFTYASKLAAPGDAVLLSPACASWDMYKSFEERGEHFKSLVQALKNQRE